LREQLEQGAVGRLLHATLTVDGTFGANLANTVSDNRL